MNDVLRCGLIGTGMMGRNHARVIREQSDVELVVVADQDGDRHKVAQGLPVVESVEEALDYNLDCVIIAVPTKLHEEVAIRCAQASVPALIEKPLADSSVGATRIKEAFEESGTFAAVGHIERFNPAIEELTNRLRAGELGEIFQISTRRQSSFPGRIADVGVVKDLATHDIDLVLAVTQSKYESVAAFTAHRSGREAEDMVIINARLGNGVIVNHVVNWLSPLKERVTVVTGESGIFVADTLTGDLTLHRNGQFDIDWESFSSFRGVSEGDVIRFAFSKKEPLKSELDNFFAGVRGIDNLSVSLKQGLEVTSVVERVLASSRMGNPKKTRS